MKINIRKGTYHKTVRKDGITHEVDTSKNYIYYAVEIYGRYYDIHSREQLEEIIKKDLQDIVNALDKEKER